MSNPTILSRLFSTSHLFARAVALTWQAHGPLALLTLVLMLVAAFVTPIQVWITKLVIDGVTSAVAQGVTSVRDPLVWRGLLLPLASYAGIWAVGQVIEGVDIQVRQLMGLQVNNYSQRLIFSKAAQLDIAFFENPAFYDQFTLARNEGYRIQNVSYQFTTIVQNSLTAVTLFIILGQITLWIPAILLLTALPRLLAVVYFTRRRADLYMKWVPEQRLTGYLSWLMGDRDAVKEMRLFQIHDYLIEQMHRANQKYFGNVARMVVAQEKTLLLLTLIMVGGIAAIWGSIIPPVYAKTYQIM